MEIVNKLWGHEQILVNNDRYCAKLLHIQPGYECSLHYHKIKKETFIVIEGRVRLVIGNRTDTKAHILAIGDSITLDPFTWHRFSSYNSGTSVILEVSSTHSDDDVVRLEPSRKLPNDKKYETATAFTTCPIKPRADSVEYGHEYARMVL